MSPRSLFQRGPRLAFALVCAVVALRAPAASAFEFLDGKIQIHGYVEAQLRMMSDGFRSQNWFFSQWANVMNLEIEADIAKDLGPFDSVSAYIRGEVRFDCIWSQACGLSTTTKLFGNRSNRVPANLANGETSGFTGVIENPFDPPQRIHNTQNNLLPFYQTPPLDGLAKLGANNLTNTFAPVLDAVVAVKKLQGSLGLITLPQGPWRPETGIEPIGALSTSPNTTGPRPPLQTLPFRPPVPNENLGIRQAHGLYAPSQAMLGYLDSYDSFDQNFSQEQLQWNHGASQEQTRELKEAYLDLELMDGALFVRAGKQNIVWGKTELFRTTDQFNPQDLALSSLPSLEESRIALWAIRAIYSFYDVGPLEDVRLEVAANLDRFQPTDLGKCGEPYTIFLVCGKTFGLFGHGLIGAGIAGELRPEDWWNDVNGLEIGARVEFRWDRFSFAITDFWGYADFPTVNTFNEYQRSVYLNPSNPSDPNNGRPLDVYGNLLTPGNALALHPGNRQAFDVFCSATVGIAGAVLPTLASACILDLLNSNQPISPALAVSPANALATIFDGSPFGQLLTLPLLASLPVGTTYKLVEMNHDVGDSVTSNNQLNAGAGLATYTTPQQQALLGCGPLYGTDCDTQGIDIFNAEASVMVQAFPMFEPNGPVATRFVNGKVVQIPGARGPGGANYNPLQDGCTGTTDPNGNPIPGCQTSNGGAGARTLVNPVTGERFQDELAALSYNFMIMLYALGSINPNQSGCFTPPAGPAMVPTREQLIRCTFVTAIFGVAGTQRPELNAGGNGQFGRRDFIWSSGSEINLRYQKRNVLGFSTDFAEDHSKTNWSMEFTWFANEAFGNTTVPKGYSNMDSLNLTLSVDRPTFINFLNQSRTFFFNMQWFVNYLPSYEGGGTFDQNGPVNALGTFSVFTGYFQDRLLPGITTVYDINSASGAVIGNVTYRFSEVFSATVGIANFWGSPGENRIPIRQPLLGNNGGDFMNQTRFDGLTALAERDEIYLQLRYTF